MSAFALPVPVATVVAPSGAYADTVPERRAEVFTAAGLPHRAHAAVLEGAELKFAYGVTGDNLSLEQLAALEAAAQAVSAAPPPIPTAAVDATLIPSPGMTYDIGSGSQRFDTLYVTTVNQLSDYRVKTDVETLTLGLELIERLRPVSFRYVDGRREHMGFLAQDVRAALLEADPGSDYAVWCSTPLAPGDRTGLPAGMDTVESLRPDQLIAPLVRTCQQLADAVADLTDAVKKQGTQLEWAAETIAAIQKAIRERPSL